MTRPLLNFDSISENYNETRFITQKVLDAFSSMLATRLPKGKDSIVLDLGVGTGLAAIPLRRAGFRVVGIDLSRRMMLRARACAVSVSDLDLAQGSIQLLPLRTGSVDAALMYHVLHLVPDPAQVLEETRRVLNKSGKLYWLADVPWEQSVLDIVRMKYLEILDRRYSTDLPSPRDFGIVHCRLLPADTVSALPLDGGVWTREVRLRQILDWYESRQFGFQLNVPDAEHRKAMSALGAWSADQYPSNYGERIDFFLEIREVTFA